MADTEVQAILNVVAEAVANARAVVPGRVTSVDRAEGRERDVTVSPGIGRIMDGVQVADGPVASAPALTMGGGGWSVNFPLVADDECIGLAPDRNPERWRQNREPGEAHSIDRPHDLSNLMLLPFSITAAEGAPDDVGEDFVIAHSTEGERMRIEAGGAITITKVSEGDPTKLATLTFDDAGNVTIEVATGKSVNIGGPSAAALALGQEVIDAVDAMLAGGVPAPNDGGVALLSSMTIAWNLVKATILALKAKGE